MYWHIFALHPTSMFGFKSEKPENNSWKKYYKYFSWFNTSQKKNCVISQQTLTKQLKQPKRHCKGKS